MTEEKAYLNCKELILFTLSEVVLPTMDIFTDYVLALKLITTPVYCNNNGSIHANELIEERSLAPIGYSMFGAIVLSTFFQFIHFWITERSFKSRMVLMPLALCQLWPQFRALRVLWIHVKKRDFLKAKQEKKMLETSIVHIGKVF